MSNSRLKSTKSKSFLNHSIQFRQIIINRAGHQSKSQQYPHPLTININKRISLPTESKLEQSLRLDPVKDRHSSRHLSSLSRSANRKAYGKYDLNKSNRIESTKNQIKQILDRFKPSSEMKSSQKSASNQHLREVKLKNGKIKKKEVKYKSIQPQKIHSIAQQNQTIEELDVKLQKLINRKLELVLRETRKNTDLTSSMVRLQNQDINEEYEYIIRQIKALKTNTSRGCELLNKKITFIQNLLAEQITEAELMKKYYYNINSNKINGKIGYFNHIKTRIGDLNKSMTTQRKQNNRKNQVSSPKQSKPLFDETTTNKQTYKEPKIEDYESYRYQQRNIPLNLQPLPRSSYKRQFLYLQSIPDEKIIKKDHSPYFPLNKNPVSSIYEQDYKSTRAQIVDHRELDAYKNKIKTLKVSYMPRNRLKTLNLERQSSNQQQIRRSCAISPSKSIVKSQNQTNFNKHMLKSENQREYKADQQYEKSQIKHKQLHQFQYKLKNKFKS